ncbi:MAG: iron chelate uptake ABC transporter family permease subunit, partial [Streptococcaceae bacterium]|nr:iron chelate uptake ABC transporter family permease subunit [Streptococcaceae bacterium]
MNNRKYLLVLTGLITSIVFLAALYLMLGDQNYSFSEIFSNSIVLQLRLPRLVAVIFAGVLLSSSGLLVQSLTNNPIAEMTTLGISGGASFALSLLLV